MGDTRRRATYINKGANDTDVPLDGEMKDSYFSSDGIGNNDSGNDGNIWFNPDNNPWSMRSRLTLHDDGLTSKLKPVGPMDPMPRDGSRNVTIYELDGTDSVHTGKDDTGKPYADIIRLDSFSGYNRAIPRDEDPHNEELYPHLADEQPIRQLYEGADLESEVADAIDNVDDADRNTGDYESDGGPTVNDILPHVHPDENPGISNEERYELDKGSKGDTNYQDIGTDNDDIGPGDDWLEANGGLDDENDTDLNDLDRAA
jgi:hypothetical protein